MKTIPLKLLTVLTSESMERTLMDDFLAAGAHGCTAVSARGRGQHGQRPSHWASGNVRLEVLGDAALIDKILRSLERYEKDSPLTCWISDVAVWPTEKFGG